MQTESLQQHWIYVLGGAELREQAQRWEQRKTRQGKKYELIEFPAGGQLASLGNVQADDVLYVVAGAVRNGRLGETGLEAAQLAERLRSEGLHPEHRALKIFASFSGDETQAGCFAERLYQAMRNDYPNLVVSGYRGQVDLEGFDGHKSAGLGAGESPEAMGREEWLKRGARARDNRVQFPAPH